MWPWGHLFFYIYRRARVCAEEGRERASRTIMLEGQECVCKVFVYLSSFFFPTGMKN